MEQSLEKIPATSPLWPFQPQLMLTAVEYLARPESARADSFSSERLLCAVDSAESSLSVDEPAIHVANALNDHPVPEVRSGLLDWLLWLTGEVGDSVRQDGYYQRMLMDLPDWRELEYWRTILSPDRNIAAGKMIPDFSVTSLEDSTVFHTRDELMGSVYLIDFWATWCPPCVAELPKVHEAYEKFKGRGFQVLSVALSDERSNIAGWRHSGFR